jgi:hypothetical protein
MKRKFGVLECLVTLALVIIPAVLAFGALTDSSAMSAAIARWGTVGMIGQKRGPTDTYWSKQVGFASPGCVNAFTVVGTGLNTWDSAFADADAHPAKVNGPYAGMLTIDVGAYDSDGVTSLQLFIDGVGQAVLTVSPPAMSYTGTWIVDTTTLKAGYHVTCVQGQNVSGAGGKTYEGVLFQVNQAIGKLDGHWLPGLASPSFSLVTFRQN